MLATAKPTVNAAPGEQGTQGPRPANRRRLFLMAVVLALVVAAAFGAWARFFSPVKVAVSHPAANVAVQVFGLGTVEARVTSKVGFKVSGVLVDLRADVGDRVAKGAVSPASTTANSRRRSPAPKAAVQQAEANLQKANASVQKAQANYDNAKRINERRQALVQSKTASVETAETAQAAQDAALADVNLAKSEVAGGARPLSATPRRSSSSKRRRWIFTR